MTPKLRKKKNIVIIKKNNELMRFQISTIYHIKLYSKCLINLAERALKRMKDDNGSIIFISSPGCNITQICRPGYDMPGKNPPISNYIMFLNMKNL